MKSDSWFHLREFTAARIALGRSGGSLPTRERLNFQLSHAMARDAVLSPFDPVALARELEELSMTSLILESCASDRSTYLRRPDLGRKLSDHSRTQVEGLAASGPWDLVIVVSDGLSSFAAMRQAAPLLTNLLPPLLQIGWRVAPLLVTRHARVAVQDEVGGLLNAEISLILLGERPGLGSPDSLGAYFTFRPVPGRTDAERNCVSNIRPEGLSPKEAARKLEYLLVKSRTEKLSGIGLKDDSPAFLTEVPISALPNPGS